MEKRIDILVKTLLNLEKSTEARIEEIKINDVRVKAEAKPQGFSGLVSVHVKPENAKWVVAEKIEGEIPEAERILPVSANVKAEIEEIVKASVETARKSFKRSETFAVRTVRRGKHPYTSIDVNVKVGSAIVEALGNQVDLEEPDKVLWVEILGSKALIGVLEGFKVWRKAKPGKYDVKQYLRRISLVQMPYLGPLNAAQTMGSRIGRAAQTFEVKELIVAYAGFLEAEPLNSFLEGLFEGINSRYKIQLKTYSHKPRKVKVLVQDLHQLVRERKNEPLIVLEPEGEPLPRVSNRIAEFFLKRSGRVNLLVGSREGIPKGVYRFASLIVDLCPGVTISTDYAASSALIAVANVIEDKLIKEKSETSPSGEVSAS
jgi:tRNA acetyltransferase TAN1